MKESFLTTFDLYMKNTNDFGMSLYSIVAVKRTLNIGGYSPTAKLPKESALKRFDDVLMTM